MLYLMSTTVIPTEGYGTWEVLPISPSLARHLIRNADEVRSAVGHESTASAMTEIIGTPIAMDRQTVIPIAGDQFICFKLRVRPPEGAILDRATLDQLGYDLVLMQYEGL